MNIKFNRLFAILFLSLCMLCANNIKSYGQHTIEFSASDGHTLTWWDVYNGIVNYMAANDLDDYPIFNAVIDAEEIGVGVFNPGSPTGNVISAKGSDVKKISKNAFTYTGLTEIDFPAVTEIGETAFSCTQLERVEFPACTKIEKNAFAECKKLYHAEFPALWTSLGVSAFNGCTNLYSVYIPRLLFVVYNRAFSGCASLTTNDELAPLGSGFTIKAVLIEPNAFSGCKSIKGLDLSHTVTIKEFAFSGCSGIKEMSLPLADFIGEEAFGDCSAIQKLNLPRVETIESFAFVNNTSLTEAALPSIKTVGNRAFWGCKKLKKVTFGSGHTEAQMIILGQQIFGGIGKGAPTGAEDIELELGENVLPAPNGNSWNGYTWKKITIVPAVPVGIVETGHALSLLRVYPNPANNIVSVECEQRATIIFYDILGKEVLSQNIDGKAEINVSHLPKGNYIVNAVSEGKVMGSSKIVKQ